MFDSATRIHLTPGKHTNPLDSLLMCIVDGPAAKELGGSHSAPLRRLPIISKPFNQYDNCQGEIL